ncbi:unnamed protein product [Rhizoctonia solani]|uniref:Uncharacterized protein n=1 Tax=Rhizoctonia solani TaxID=456999 RepID=A0A8H3GQS8_9AGAM|nr:unnamed protein product [Rhizoctonia solani]
MVDRATHRIVQLLQMFEEQHEMKFFPRNMIHVIYECGIVFLKEFRYVPLGATKKRVAAMEACHVCLRALRGASVTWPWAEHLAGELEANLHAARSNITAEPFLAEWAIPVMDNYQPKQNLYPLVHSYDSLGADTETNIKDTASFSGTLLSSAAPYPPPQQAPQEVGEETWGPYMF